MLFHHTLESYSSEACLQSSLGWEGSVGTGVLGKLKKVLQHEDTPKPKVSNEQNEGCRKETTRELHVGKEMVQRKFWAGDL